MTRARAVLAAHRRNLRLLRGNPSLAAQAVLVPVIVLVLCALIFGGGGDDWPVAVVDAADTEESQAVVAAIERSQSNVSPYFSIVETDRQRAQEMLARGRLQLLIEVPEDFDRSGTLAITTHNINSDAMKNLRLRVEHALNRYDFERGVLPLTVDLRTARPQDVPRTAFIAGGATLLALFFGAALLAANLYAVEEEGRTSKEMLLTPLGNWCGALGTLVTGAVVGYLTAVPTFVVGWLAFGFRPAWGDLALVAAFLLPLMVAFAGVGVLLAHLLRRHRSIQPIVILTAIATFFAGGGFVSVPGLPPAARAFAAVWVPSRVFEWANPVLHGFGAFPGRQWLWALFAAALGAAVTVLASRRELSLPSAAKA